MVVMARRARSRWRARARSSGNRRGGRIRHGAVLPSKCDGQPKLYLAHARRLVRSARAQLGDPLAPTPCADSTRSGTRSFFQANLADHLPDHRLNRINALSSKAPPGDAADW